MRCGQHGTVPQQVNNRSSNEEGTAQQLLCSPFSPGRLSAQKKKKAVWALGSLAALLASVARGALEEAVTLGLAMVLGGGSLLSVPG